ncbi:MAG: glycosyltransferase family 4 protein [Actinomycetota bacterium]
MSALLIPALARVAPHLGLVDVGGEGDLKIHQRSIPLVGGLALAAAVGAALTFVGGLPRSASALGLAVALVMGIVDDRHHLPPGVRLVLQGVCGLAIAAGYEAGLAAGIVILTVAVMNGVNLLDGQDALAGGVVAIALLGMLGVGAAPGGTNDLVAAAVGGIAGFLLWNRPPARVFLGSGGAYALGALLVVVAAPRWTSMWTMVGLAACMTLPLYEVVATLLRRSLAPRKMFHGDRDHSYDVLARRLGRLRTTICFWALGALCAGLGIGIAQLQGIVAGFLTAGLIAGLGVGSWWHIRAARRPEPETR